jgi:CO/xanthine dehydrogenase Mo-binding subunit
MHAFEYLKPKSTDFGQGSDTVISQVVAEVLGVRVEDINVVDDDTEVCSWDVGVHASRTTFVACNSTIGEAKKAKEQILELAAGYVEVQRDKDGAKREIKLDKNPGNLVMRGGMIFSKRAPETKIPLGKILRGSHYKTDGKMVMAEYFYDPDNENLDREFKGDLSMAYAYGIHGVEVEVDRETGKGKILKYVAAHHVGRAINPMLLEGQIYGPVSMGVGYGLTEQLILDRGIEIRIFGFPITPEKILKALRGSEGNKTQ